MQSYRLCKLFRTSHEQRNKSSKVCVNFIMNFSIYLFVISIFQIKNPYLIFGCSCEKRATITFKTDSSADTGIRPLVRRYVIARRSRGFWSPIFWGVSRELQCRLPVSSRPAPSGVASPARSASAASGRPAVAACPPERESPKLVVTYPSTVHSFCSTYLIFFQLCSKAYIYTTYVVLQHD